MVNREGRPYQPKRDLKRSSLCQVLDRLGFFYFSLVDAKLVLGVKNELWKTVGFQKEPEINVCSVQ